MGDFPVTRLIQSWPFNFANKILHHLMVAGTMKRQQLKSKLQTEATQLELLSQPGLPSQPFAESTCARFHVENPALQGVDGYLKSKLKVDFLKKAIMTANIPGGV